MPDRAPLDLAYTPFNTGTLSWQRDGDLLLLTISPPRLSSPIPNHWWRIPSFWAALLGRLRPARRHLLIRVNRHKLLLDEAGHTSAGGGGIPLSLTGRAYTADEITSVTAKGSSLRIRTRTRRLARMSITGYAPADLAFAAAAIRTVLADGVDAWTQSQHPSDGPPKSPLPEPPKNP